MEALPPPPPVILVHGMKDDARKMSRLARHLEATGRRTYSCDLLPNMGQVGIDDLAQQLEAFIGKTINDQQSFDLVGFSMGGLVSRFYLQRRGGLTRVRRFVTIATPHRGSLLAYLIPNKGCRQMRPGSAFLADLNHDADQLSRVAFTSLWTPLDLMVFPASNSVTPAARCLKIWCIAHPLMVFTRRCHLAVEEALR